MIEPRAKNIGVGAVVRNLAICRDHNKLTFRMRAFAAAAAPGQFVHLCSDSDSPADGSYRVVEWDDSPPSPSRAVTDAPPMLRRAYSIADLRLVRDAVEIDVLYRVVGRGTRWLQTLAPGDSLSVLGPLGNAFPLSESKRHAWMVAGGVGLPPMLWLSQALRRAGKTSVALCGAQSEELLALTLVDGVAPAADAKSATLCAAEFARHDAPAVISTDDGTLGFRGHVGSALEAFHRATSPDPRDLVVYTCGPERMMRFVAEFCVARGIECHVCMERAMACGTGMCQSCVVPLRDDAGWSYRLCCTDGPIFRADNVLWEAPAK